MGVLYMGKYRDTYFDNNPGNYGWYTCVRCGRKFRKGDIDIDHIIPQNRGGGDSEFNLQCMCKHCNRSKKDDMGDTVPDLMRSTRRIAEREIKGSFLGSLFGKKK